MISILKRNNWILVKIIVFVSIVIPVGITAYELIILGKESVLFLGDYPAALGIILVIYYALLLVIGIIWIIMQLKSLMTLKNEKIKNELLHLQSQVNPHFFFNILNNLYGMVGKDAEKAQELILKLSDMMRYSIYEGEKDFVTLNEEVEYLQNYMDLHQMRYQKKINIVFNTQIQEDYKVMPLMFILLLENAFKHGVENLRDNAFVHIDLNTNEGNLFFSVENNFDSEIIEKSGIGLDNLKRRLELVYPNKHDLSFSVRENVYKAQLILNKL